MQCGGNKPMLETYSRMLQELPADLQPLERFKRYMSVATLL